MEKITVRISTSNGRIILTPPPGVELVLESTAADEFLTIAEAAKRYNISRNTLAKMCDTGGLAYELRGKNRFVNGADVEAIAAVPRRRGRKKADANNP
ncbi:MAG: helix-turn-helix domain-containing protein [Planctomycetaceae bacterium]|nr:helix-turn-helix domain-containing protein [Planctomycetaceae bacterium]